MSVCVLPLGTHISGIYSKENTYEYPPSAYLLGT